MKLTDMMLFALVFHIIGRLVGIASNYVNGLLVRRQNDAILEKLTSFVTTERATITAMRNAPTSDIQ